MPATGKAGALSESDKGTKAIPVSSYPSLVSPGPNAPGKVIPGQLDSPGRPAGVTAALREDSLGAVQALIQ